MNLSVGCLMSISSLLIVAFLGAPKTQESNNPPTALFRLMALETDCINLFDLHKEF